MYGHLNKIKILEVQIYLYHGIININMKLKKEKKIEDKKLDEKKNTIVYKRYYHLFKKEELDEIVNKAG